MSKKSPKKLTESELITIKELFHLGFNPYKIAKKLNLPTSVISYHTKKITVTKPNNFTDPVVEAYLAYIHESKNLKTKFLKELEAQIH